MVCASSFFGFHFGNLLLRLICSFNGTNIVTA
jgi:hypothetical protein